MAKSNEAIYHGRLMCDGNGNLLADESKRVGMMTETIEDSEGNQYEVAIPAFKYGQNHGRPVASHEGSYVFLNDGDESHNDRHHKKYANMAGTVDESMTDDSSLVNADDKKNQHHFAVQSDDSHYRSDAPNSTRLTFDRDKEAATITGHTDAYAGGDK